MGVVLFFFNIQLATFLVDNKEEAQILSKWFYFIPLSMFFMGVFNAISFWFNRKTLYKRMAVSKVINTSVMTGIQVSGGGIGFTPVSLLVGFVSGRLFAVLFLFYKLKKDSDSVFLKVTKNKMLSLLKKYKKFPYFTLPAEFVNVISSQLPIFVISKYFGGITLGNYSLMERVLNAPISLLGTSVLDVFKQIASKDYVRYGNCKNIFLKTLKTLVLLSIIPTVLLFFFSPIVFGVIFGKEWVMAGEFAQIFSVLFFFKFTASPLSYMFFIAEKQQYDMFLQIGLLILTIVSFVIGIYYNNVKTALIWFVSLYSLMYVLYLYLSYTFAKGEK